ncbi:MAG: glycosyltransferase [Bacteroidia bacterium]|nr:glycosyltransferase [Bacteroidia bacterium]NNM23188.1 glycosyltransferase [Flavobacteriaceae bacterium]
MLIIIPCYNEEDRLELSTFEAFSLENAYCDFLFVNDGSSDKTAEMLESFCSTKAHFNWIDLEKNVGKAEAIRHGVLSVRSKSIYEFIGYMDADLATPLTEIPYFIHEISRRAPRPLFVMGARIARMGASIERKARRHYLGRVFATFVSNVLRFPVYDTQCGAKMIDKSVVFTLFEAPLITKWLFDVELIARLKRHLGTKNAEAAILEIPLNEWKDVAGSKLKLSDFLKAPFELFRIWRAH